MIGFLAPSWSSRRSLCAFAPTMTSNASVLLRSGAECSAGDAYLGGSMTLSACQSACHNTLGCRYFVFGHGAKAGECYHEFTSDAACPEGWQIDDYDFYQLVTWRHVGSVSLRRHVECRSADAKLGDFPGRVDECAAACARKTGCHYFIFGTGYKEGSCWHEHTSDDDCPEGFEVDEYDFLELGGSGDAVVQPTSPSFLVWGLILLALAWVLVCWHRRSPRLQQMLGACEGALHRLGFAASGGGNRLTPVTSTDDGWARGGTRHVLVQQHGSLLTRGQPQSDSREFI